MFAGLESAHAHSDAKVTGPCAICISIHANAPAITFHLLPTLRPVQAVAVARQVEGLGIAQEPRLFIRPPPSVYSGSPGFLLQTFVDFFLTARWSASEQD